MNNSNLNDSYEVNHDYNKKTNDIVRDYWKNRIQSKSNYVYIKRHSRKNPILLI